MKVTNRKDSGQLLLQARRLDIHAPGGRPLFRDLNINLERERVALIGRNGAGKSSLLEVLSKQANPRAGEVVVNVDSVLVGQHLDPVWISEMVRSRWGGCTEVWADEVSGELAEAGLPLLPPLSEIPRWSRGEMRKVCLVTAKTARPELLFLDEPSQDLDDAGLNWLTTWLADFRSGLMLVSHDRRLLRYFSHFFIVAESGCDYFRGSLANLERELVRRSTDEQARYVRNLNVLMEREQHNERVNSRRRRKKNLGRIHEIRRAPSRAKLNENRGYAQESQGKRSRIRKQRIGAVRTWAKATRRALAVTLPLQAVMPRLPDSDSRDNIVLEGVSATVGGRRLFAALDLRIRRHRVAVMGANGVGKTTLLRMMLGHTAPNAGAVKLRSQQIGSIAQGATDWMLEESLLSCLLKCGQENSPETLAQLLVGHRFPLALAERSLRSLSPGERLRAALICLFQRFPPIELLVLDEPTYSLDFSGAVALRAVLSEWRGGLVVATHDYDFVASIGIEKRIWFDGNGSHEISTLTAAESCPNLADHA